MNEWVIRYRRKVLLRKLMFGEKSVDLLGYFKLWAKNSKNLSLKLNGIEKWRKFVIRKEKSLKLKTMQKVRDYNMIREKEILEEKIEQSKNSRQKIAHKIFQSKIQGLNNLLKKLIITK